MSIKNSIALIKQYKEGTRISSGMLGKHHTEETKQKISSAKMKKPFKKCIVCGKLFNHHKPNIKFCSCECAGNYSLPIGSIRNSNKYDGYLQIKTIFGWEHQHRYVMEQYLGRKLNSGEEVHHIDGDKKNNNLSNLFILDKKEHSRTHAKLFNEVCKLRWENKWLLNKLKESIK